MDGHRLYRHQVRAPLVVWAFALFVAGMLAIATGAALGDRVGWAVFAVAFSLPAVLLIQSTVVIEVTDRALVVDRASLPLTFVGAVTVLDREAARVERGPALDPASHLVLRGWIPTAVRIENTDVADQVPYWYISTRDPDGLRDALERARHN